MILNVFQAIRLWLNLQDAVEANATIKQLYTALSQARDHLVRRDPHVIIIQFNFASEQRELALR